jgi:hypothetical protein
VGDVDAVLAALGAGDLAFLDGAVDVAGVALSTPPR